MKRKNPRLSLSLETLKKLETAKLDDVAGRGPSLLEPTACAAATCVGRCYSTYCS